MLYADTEKNMKISVIAINLFTNVQINVNCMLQEILTKMQPEWQAEK